LGTILARLFGEHATAAAVREFYERAGAVLDRGQGTVALGSGMALAGLSAIPAAAAAVPRHRFYGD
jgi:hypothetical protein